MNHIINSIHNSIRARELFFELVDVAKAKGLEEERYGFKSLFMGKDLKDRKRVIKDGLSELTVGEKEIDGKTITYVKWKAPNHIEIYEWDASQTNPTMSVRNEQDRKGILSDLEGLLLTSKPATTFPLDDMLVSKELQEIVMNGLQELKNESYFHRELSDLADNIVRVIDVLHQQGHFDNAANKKDNSEKMQYAYIKNSNGAQVEIQTPKDILVRDSFSTKTDPVEQTVRIRNHEGKPVYEISLHGNLQKNTNVQQEQVHALTHIEMRIFQGDTIVKIPPEQISKFALELQFINTLNETQNTAMLNKKSKNDVEVEQSIEQRALANAKKALEHETTTFGM